MIVIDASALTDFLIGRTSAIAAVSGEFAGHEHTGLHAPELVEPETLSALRRMARSGALTDARASAALADLAALRLVRYPHAPLRDRVWALRHNLTAYDATYLALAEALDATLLTADRGLAACARRSIGASAVREIA